MKTMLYCILFFWGFGLAQAQGTLDTNLVAFYPFNGNANDESGNGNDGTVTNAVLTTNRFNQNDSAYYFNGSNARIVIPSSNSLNINNDISISAWVKPEEIQTSGNRMILGKSNYSSNTNYVFRITPNGCILWEYASSLNTISDPLTANNWYHIVLTSDSTNGLKQIFINGELIISEILTSPGAFGLVTNPLTIGAAYYYGSSWAEYFKGSIDDIRIYNRVLDASEIRQLFIEESYGLVAFLPLNGNTIDVSGNGYDGIVNGNATLTSDRFNAPESAFTFPDQSSNISLANTTNLNLENGFTINTWIKYKNAYSVIVGKHTCGYANGFLFGIDWSGQITLWAANSSTWSTVQTNDFFNEDQWYMVSITYDGSNGNAEVYVDGESKGTGSVTYNNFSSYPISIGEAFQNNCSPANMSGAVDEVKIYNRVLSDTEILAEYNSSSNSLVAFWPFNNNVNDSSGNSNDGISYNVMYSKDRYGIDASSIYFDGVDSYVEGLNPGNNLPYGSTPRTISCWIKSIDASSSRNIFHYGTAEVAATNYHLFMQEGKYVGVGNGYGFGILISNKDIGDTTWNFITTVYEGSGSNLQHIFINGKLDTSAVISDTPNTILGSNWKMGQFMGGSPSFLGNIDDLQIYNLALIDQEIINLYKSTTTAPNLIAPVNNVTLNTLTPSLYWDSLITATNYRLIISTDSNFTYTISDEIVNRTYFLIGNGVLSENMDYYWKVRTINDGGIGPWSVFNRFSIILTDVEDEHQLPTEFALMQNYPNPFNPSTVISYQLPVSGEVTLKIYDILGNEVATLVNEYRNAGSYEIEFNPESSIKSLASGVYFYQLKAGSFIETKKLMLLK